MQKVIRFFTDTRTLVVLGFLALAGFLFFGMQIFEIAASWIIAIIVIALLVWGSVWFYRRWQARRSSEQLGNMLETQADKAASKAQSSRRDEVDVIRKRMVEAIGTIKSSKLGITSGSSALYELPWYMIIGNPAAGKSSAIANSGLQFPFADKDGNIVQGIGGTRNCDWFFTTDGILLDTAGRYAVHEEDREEWFGFLDLLKKFRKRAPINGIIIAVSIAELTANRPEFGINLAKNLRQRVQELTERLEVFAPVYIMFTKVDLIAGFNEFFRDANSEEISRVWGATQAYSQNTKNQDILSFFDERFDELYNGLKDMSLANMAMYRGEEMPPGLLTFPLEFAAIKNSLRAFILTLFEDNPYQFRPVFRGFYFTSALQEGASLGASSQRVADRFELSLQPQTQTIVHARNGFFLLNLFRKVIFADKALVAQYSSKNKMRLRYASFLAAMLVLGISLAGWSWSYQSNTQLVANVQADMDQAVRLQDKHADLQSRLDALQILQDRIDQLQKYHTEHPWSLGLGLYQGDLLERKLREEYFSGVREILLKPVQINLEAFLHEVNANADKLSVGQNQASADAASPTATAVVAGADKLYQDASPTRVEDAYNALKTYLMLGDRSHAEAGHLNDQITRFWRGWLDSNRGQMPRGQMIRSAESVLSFYLAQINDPSWPTVEENLALVDQTREALRKVVHGMPARERIYADIKARASTRYASMTVARIVGEQDRTLVAGSYVIPGAFTREAWEGYIQDAFKEAANKQLQSTDWVLKTSSSDDLTLEGSPEQIQKSLTDQYKTEYAQAWQSFLQGVVITDLGNFDQAVVAMNRLGDPQNSPIAKLTDSVYQQTSWDNPSLVNAGLQQAQSGFINWFKSTILRQTPGQLNLNINANGASNGIPMGPVGQRFAGIARLVAVKDRDQSLMQGYLAILSKLRSRFNQIHNQGDVGPGARQLMQQTLDGSGSELADGLKYVDEQMLQGMTDGQKQMMRPLLVRPLMQAFAAIIRPAEVELNKTWAAQVYNPFQLNLASKYPFSPNAHLEASSQEIGQIFGSDGSLAKFFGTDMASLVVRRGDMLAPRTWADLGIHLSPQVTASFASWIAPVSTGGVASGGGVAAQTLFQIQPLPAAGVLEYTIEIDGQQLRYRNTQAGWSNFVWPNAQGAPGARIVAVTFDGRSIEVVNEPGRFGLERLLSTATRKRKEDGVFELSWGSGGTSVAVNLKLISSPQATNAPAGSSGTGYRGMTLPQSIIADAPAPAQVANANPPVAPSTEGVQ
ncbi:MAG: type VI secretion system membrane subunit TssM [Sulfuriferula sp.]|nr:type VI secretion system membrane subunit TssM [Sulfuriferula sp.]